MGFSWRLILAFLEAYHADICGFIAFPIQILVLGVIVKSISLRGLTIFILKNHFYFDYLKI